MLLKFVFYLIQINIVVCLADTHIVTLATSISEYLGKRGNHDIGVDGTGSSYDSIGVPVFTRRLQD